MSEEKHKAYRLFLILALLVAGFLMGVFAMGMYRDAQSEQDERAWRMIGSNNLDEFTCARIAQQNGRRRDSKFLDWCVQESAKLRAQGKVS